MLVILIELQQLSNKKREMNKIYNPRKTDWKDVLKRPTQTVADIEGLVDSIFKEVAQKGDEALKKYTAQYDKVCLLYTSPSPRDRTRSRMPSSA